MDKTLKELLGNGFNDYDFSKTKELLTEIMEGLVPAISFEKFNQLVSSDIDQVIVKVLQTGRTFIGGSMTYVLLSDKDWEVEYTFYTQDKDSKLFRNKGKGGPYKLAFLEEQSRKKLLEKKKVEFELLPPKSDIKEKEVTEKLDEQETSFGKDVTYEAKSEK